MTATASSYTRKALRITLALSNNAKFQGTDSNKLVLTNLRCSASMNFNGMPSFPEANVLIHGMLQADMNALLSIAFRTNFYTRNSLIVEADSGNGFTMVFAGDILNAQPDYASAPDVGLRVQARTLFFESLAPAAAVSYTGATDVATIVSTLAAKMGYAFVNNGVTAQLDSPYLANTSAEQLRDVCRQAGVDCYIDGIGGDDPTQSGSNTITICPKGTPRDVPVFTLSPTAGLVGYPVRDSRGYINLRTQFNPAFRQGGLVNLATSGTPNIPDNSAFDVNNGTWLIGTVKHLLESQVYRGGWFSDLLCYPRGEQAPLV